MSALRKLAELETARRTACNDNGWPLLTPQRALAPDGVWTAVRALSASATRIDYLAPGVIRIVAQTA